MDVKNMKFSSINYKINDRNLAKLSILSFLFIISCLSSVLLNSPADGYELSIYNAYSPFFWICLISSILISLVIIILSAIYNSNYWKCGFLSLLMSYAIVFFLPIIRGYVFFSRGDSDLFYHLKHINIILSSFHVHDSLFYPMTHILTSILYSVSSLSLRFSTFFICFFFYVVYLLSLYTLGMGTVGNNRFSLFLLALGSPLFFSFLHYAFFPYFFALSLFPLIFYCFINTFMNKYYGWRILIIIFIFCIVFFHPLVTLILFVVFIMTKIYQFLSKKPVVVNDIILLLVSFLSWYLSFRAILKRIPRIINAIFYTGDSSIFDKQMNAIESNEANISLIFERFFLNYGAASLYLFVAFLCIIFIFKRRNSIKMSDLELLFGLQFLGSIFFSCVHIFSYLVVLEPIRAIQYPTMIAVILCGIFFYKLFENSRSVNVRNFVCGFMFLMIFSASILGVFNLYESPLKGLPGKHFSHMETSGENWFLQNANTSLPLMIKYSSFRKYELYNSKLDSFEPAISENKSINSHFGYSENNTLSHIFNYEERYMITDELHRQGTMAIDANRRSRLDQYDVEDFHKLNQDSTVSKIYVNSEFEVWKT